MNSSTSHQTTSLQSLKLDDSSPISSQKGSESPFGKKPSLTTKTSKRYGRAKPLPIREVPEEINQSEPSLIETLFSTEERSEEQVRQIYELIKHFSFFDVINSRLPGYSFKEPALLDLCSKLKFEKYVFDKSLFSEGDSTSGKVYLIYSGEVSLYKKLEPLSLENSHDGLPRRGESPVLGVSSTLSEVSSPLFHRNNVKPKNNTFAPTNPKHFITELETTSNQTEPNRKAGDFVGEETLFTWEPRQYSAVTNGPCELLVLSRRDFHLTREKHDEKRKRLLSFLDDFVPQFRASSTHKLLDELVCVVEEKIVERGANLMVEGEIGNQIFMVFDGTLEVLKNIRVDESSNMKDTLVSVKQLLRVGPGYNDPVPIGQVSKGALVGDEIVFGKQDSYNCSIRVTSGSALIFSIQKSILIEKFPKAVQDELWNLFAAKSQYYVDNIKKCLLKKYPHMEISPILLNAGKNLFASRVVLVPQKNAEMNLKTRVGMFRKPMSEEMDSVPSPDRKKKTVLIKAETSPNSPQLLSFQRSGSPSPTHELSSPLGRNFLEHSPRVAKLVQESLEELSDTLEEEGEEGGISKEFKALKAKISRRYIGTENFGPSQEYLSSSPIKISRTLTDKGLSIRKTRIEGNKSKTESILDDNLQASPRYEADSNTEKNPAPASNGKNKGMESLEAIKEIRKTLLGNDASTKEFEMAQRRLKKAKSTIKLPVEGERDLSHEKRINMILKPYKEKLQSNVMSGLQVLSGQTKQSSDGRRTGSPRKGSITPLFEENMSSRGDLLSSKSFEKYPATLDTLSNNWAIEVFKTKKTQTILIREKVDPEADEDQQADPAEYVFEKVLVPSPKSKLGGPNRANFEATRKLKYEIKTAILKYKVKKVKRTIPSFESFSPTPKKVEATPITTRQNLSIKLPAMPQVFIQSLGNEKGIHAGSLTTRR